MNVFALFEMARPGNAIIALVTLGAGYFLSGAAFCSGMLFADSIAMALAIAFANIHNDVLDVDSDRVNRPERPLPSGMVTMRAAKAACVIVVVFAIAVALLPGADALVHIAFYAALFAFLYLYNRYLKHLPLVKNMVVAVACATPLLRAFFLPESSMEPLFPAIGFAFLYTLAREIIKDLEDVAGDTKAGILTFPIAAGERKASTLAVMLVAVAWLLLPLPSMLGWYPATFLLAVLPMTPLTVMIVAKVAKKDFGKAQKLVKIAMICGLLSLILSKFL